LKKETLQQSLVNHFPTRGDEAYELLCLCGEYFPGEDIFESMKMWEIHVYAAIMSAGPDKPGAAVPTMIKVQNGCGWVLFILMGIVILYVLFGPDPTATLRQPSSSLPLLYTGGAFLCSLSSSLAVILPWRGRPR
jgi:hypothetical protein